MRVSDAADVDSWLKVARGEWPLAVQWRRSMEKEEDHDRVVCERLLARG